MILCARAVYPDYLAEGKLSFWCVNDSLTRTLINVNSGSLGAAGNASNDLATVTSGVVYSMPGAIVGDGDRASFFDYTTRTEVPFNSAFNTPNTQPFSVEAWLYPVSDQVGTGMGWVVYQRDPNLSYKGPPAMSGESGLGWTFRPYTGSGGSSGGDLQLAAPYNLGEWLHFVVTWEPFQDMGAVPSGSEQWMGVLTGYINGVPVATNGDLSLVTGPVYAANASPTADGRTPADFAVGSYNAGSGYGEEFEGDVDEVAFYNNYALTPDQILTHYQTGTNAHPATNYASLVFNAAGDTYYAMNGTIPERTTIPPTYLRFNELAYFPATNAGSLGYLAGGSLVLTTNSANGPTSAGFEPDNTAVALDGTTNWVSLNNPLGLEVTGKITLEAWIKPDTTQGNLARIISHGPPTPTVYDTNTYPIVLSESQLSSNEVFLRIEGGTTYAVGTSDGFTTHGASAAVTAGDLGGANGWIYLAGTYDGSLWNLYRNGVPIATTADAVGALPVTGGEWAIGATGMGWGDFYTGLVDEVAIYGTALSAATIQNHYNVAQNGAVTLNLNPPVLKNGQLTISWTGTRTLLQSTNVALPMSQWTAVPGNPTSPYQVTPAAAGPRWFYRLKQ